MENKRQRALRVGVMVFSALAIFVAIIYLIGSKDNLFSSKIRITTSFNDIRGVVVGNNVRYSGINVGRVSKIKVTSDSTVVLWLDIVKEYTQFIYEDALVEINQDGLMGNKILNITSGGAASGSIQEGSHLRAKEGIDIEGMLGEAHDILVETHSAVTALRSIAQKIDSGDGDLARLLNNNTLTSRLTVTTERLNSSLANVNEITGKINNGQGDLGILINEQKLTAQVGGVLSSLNNTADKTNQVVSSLEVAAGQITQGEGTVNLLLNSKETAQNIDTTIVRVQSSLEQFNKTAKAIEDSWIIRLFSKKKKKEDSK